MQHGIGLSQSVVVAKRKKLAELTRRLRASLCLEYGWPYE